MTIQHERSKFDEVCILQENIKVVSLFFFKDRKIEFFHNDIVDLFVRILKVWAKISGNGFLVLVLITLYLIQNNIQVIFELKRVSIRNGFWL